MFHFHIDDQAIHKVHFIGIGGVSMSGMAELLQAHGYAVSGSDNGQSAYLAHLEELGIPISRQQGADNIQDQDLFIYTDAVPETNPELQAARATGRTVVSRGQFLGALMENYPQSIAVSGCHGKSTTTSMLTDIYREAQVDTTVLLGGVLDDIGGNIHIGHSDHFLAEACEYKNNIQYYLPHTAVVANIDEDHLDFFHDLQEIITAFEVFMDHLGPEDIAVLNADDPHSVTLPGHVKGQVLTFGVTSDQAMYRAVNIRWDEHGHPTYDLRLPDGQLVPFQLQVLGLFNVYNALAATVAALANGLPVEAVQIALANYKNLHRRMEAMGTCQGTPVFTDYGHHPAEIAASLGALKPQVQGKLYCVFQPHTYTRTHSLMDRFSKAFKDCDLAIITDILGVREQDDGSVSSQQLVDRINAETGNALYIPDFARVEAFLRDRIQPEDTVLTLGAGTINQLAESLVNPD